MKTNHWGLKALGAMPSVSISLIALMAGSVDRSGEAFLMVAVVWTFSSIFAGIALWWSAMKLEDNGL